MFSLQFIFFYVVLIVEILRTYQRSCGDTMQVSPAKAFRNFTMTGKRCSAHCWTTMRTHMFVLFVICIVSLTMYFFMVGVLVLIRFYYTNSY